MNRDTRQPAFFRLSAMRGAAFALLMTGFAGVAVVAACSEESSSAAREDPRRPVLDTMANGIAIPLYQRFESSVGELESTARAFCDAPSAGGLEATRDAWGQARKPWKQADVFAFGPYFEEPLRLGPKVDFWPMRERNVQAVLEASEPIDQAYMDSQGAAAKGLPVIEYLVYGNGMDDAEVLAAFEGEAGASRRCDYLVALTVDLKATAEEMVQAWAAEDSGFASELTTAGNGSQTYDSLTMAINTAFNRLNFAVEDVRELKLGKPMGKRSGGTPQPEDVESRFSKRSVQDMIHALEGVRFAYTGQYDGKNMPSFSERVSARDPELDQRVRDAFDAAIKALEAISEPLGEAVQGDQAQAEAAYQAIKALHVLIGVDVSNLLGVTVMFNNTDAD